ncbi:MAG: TetR/AcrR family transcriptional regulator [Chitinophagaceae bacterium]|nr:TetR/AcrR family transcriptional regulator [Chitinophagaceae bacterium]
MDIKERIQQKAKDLFHRYGIKSITMDEIATQLGASKKTIYQYFSDKDELVDAIVTEMICGAQNMCSGNAATGKDAVHELFQAMDFVQQIFSDMNPAMMYDLERFHPQSYKRFLDHKNKFLFQVIRENLKRGIQEELYRPDINIDILARFRLEGMMIAFNQDVFPSTKFNLAELHKIIIEHFLFGVASLKGYKLILKYQQERLKS